MTFAGCYLALFLLLWCILLRGVSIELSGHIAEPLWRSFWHFLFVTSNVLLAVLIGAALGNVVRGVPIGAEGRFSLALFTNFSPRGQVGILDWYTVSIALFILLTFAAHGATGLARRTDGPVRDRSMRLAALLWKVEPLALLIVTIETMEVRPELFGRMLHQPLGLLSLICLLGALYLLFTGLRRGDESRALIGSNLFIVGLMVGGAVGVFPLMLRSTIAPAFSLSAYQTAASAHGLHIALVWWPIALLFAIGYFFFTYRHYSGKVQLVQDAQTPY